ncbi:GSCFA domain-containing protein [Derxia gummosa]|uniref:GSCFA domain-containing protein n=1 Tax=Derxia gummosa DSM 723 TaxID=1121388 RepID=A0A8B6XBJ6_9BURK|nr:GSCFA domain-containing protein [Derxia gummosa]
MSMVIYEQDGVRRRTSGSFYRGETVNYHPQDASFERADAIEQYFVHGWMPEKGFVSKNTPIVAFGSCFAANISKYLHARGYDVLTKRDNKSYVTSMGDGIVHTFALRQQFEWAWLRKVPTVELWHGYKAEQFGYSEDARRDTEMLFNRASVFIITLGLSEIWYDEPTGEVFWRAVPASKIDPSRHKFRVSTHAENLENLRAIHALIRRFRPEVPVLFTVSPIPLTATFRPVSCITANSVSKAILRSALDEFIREANDPKLFYFPSYEIVMHGFNHQWIDDRKHVYSHVLDFNMKVFEHFFCTPGLPREELESSFRRALLLDQAIGREGHSVAAVKPATERRPLLTRDERIEQRREARRAARVAERIQQRKQVKAEATAAAVPARKIASAAAMPAGVPVRPRRGWRARLAAWFGRHAA